MAEEPVALRGRAANVSRRELLGGMASTPFATAVRAVPSEPVWDRVLRAYSATHYRHEAFVATTLQPAYERFKADLAQSGSREFGARPAISAREARDRIAAIEDPIIEAGGGRAELESAPARSRVQVMIFISWFGGARRRAHVCGRRRLRRAGGRLVGAVVGLVVGVGRIDVVVHRSASLGLHQPAARIVAVGDGFGDPGGCGSCGQDREESDGELAHG